MIKKLIFLAISILTASLQANEREEIPEYHPPSQVLILRLLEEDPLLWKEISRGVTKWHGIVELIPTNQTIINWTSLIAFQYGDGPSSNTGNSTIDEVATRILKAMIAEYPEGTAKSALIEKNEKDFIYEWVLYKHHENTPPQHEIARLFITDDGGYHRIGFTRRYGKLSEEEKTALIQLFKKSVSLGVCCTTSRKSILRIP